MLLIAVLVGLVLLFIGFYFSLPGWGGLPANEPILLSRSNWLFKISDFIARAKVVKNYRVTVGEERSSRRGV